MSSYERLWPIYNYQVRETSGRAETHGAGGVSGPSVRSLGAWLV